MTETTTNPEQDLIHRLQLQELKYDDATRVIEDLAGAAARNDPPNAKQVIALQTKLAEIRTSAAAVETARQSMEASGGTRSATLNTLLQQQASRLSQFLSRIDELKDTFSAGKNQLSTELDAHAARRSMQQAYKRSMKTA